MGACGKLDAGIFTNKTKNTFTAYNRDPGLSDHFSQVLHSQVHQGNASLSKETAYIWKRVHSDEGVDLFRSLLQTVDWRLMFSEDRSVDEWYDGFVSKVKRYYEAAFPIKRVKKGKPQKRLNWLTKGIRKSRETYEMLSLLERTTMSKISDYFKMYKRVYKRVIKKSKEMCNAERIGKAVS